jgi:hypothetical protein
MWLLVGATVNSQFCQAEQLLGTLEGRIADGGAVIGGAAAATILFSGGTDSPIAGPIAAFGGAVFAIGKTFQYITKSIANNFGGCSNVLSTD